MTVKITLTKTTTTKRVVVNYREIPALPYLSPKMRPRQA